MHATLTFSKHVKLIFTVLYAVTLGGCIEFMCRYLFFSYTRRGMELPGIAKWILIEEVPRPYFPQDYTYVLMTLIPVLLLLIIVLLANIYSKIDALVEFSISACNMIVTLIFTTYTCAFLYCIYIFSVPEFLDPPTYSSRSSTFIKCIFIVILIALVLDFFVYIILLIKKKLNKRKYINHN